MNTGMKNRSLLIDPFLYAFCTTDNFSMKQGLLHRNFSYACPGLDLPCPWERLLSDLLHRTVNHTKKIGTDLIKHIWAFKLQQLLKQLRWVFFKQNLKLWKATNHQCLRLFLTFLLNLMKLERNVPVCYVFWHSDGYSFHFLEDANNVFTMKQLFYLVLN